MRRYVVGIDAGGTGIRAVLADVSDGQTLAEFEVASAPSGGPEPLGALLEPLLTHADCASISAVCAGLTKVSRAGVEDAWNVRLRTVFPQAAVTTVPDYVIAFHGALPGGVGIAAVAGTGSVVYGESVAGTSVRVGGRGWEFGDEGSGSWLTSEMIRRSLRALDGLEKPGTLTDAICEFLSTRDPSELGEAARRTAVESGRGFLAPLALDLANAGNDEATNLFVGAAGWLGVQVRAAGRRLGLTKEEPVNVAMIGGLWSAGLLISEPFGLVVRRYFPEAVIVQPAARPALGAARMALRSICAETRP